ncbi:MAG: TniQ family protein [Ferrovibrio sp.]|uniref:TniQ family protein n=1 Tax=Ferrovibrio sp. TaxID=1917215 RepID=UPI00261873A0|nr:TniQ family protein [Ferrovibrio sp.]MCW0234749.1 TniQ family protein [Ferrovibrio sp.]
MANPIEPLPLRIENPGHDESLNSFIGRLGTRNGVFNISSWASSTFGIHFAQETYSDDAIERISVASGIPAARLQLMQEHHFILGNAYEVGDRVAEPAIVLRKRRVCPACLREHGFTKTAAEMRFVRICPEHRTHLVCHVPGTEELLTWNTKAPNICGDNIDLSSIQQQLVDPVFLEGQTYLLNAMNGIEQFEPPLLRGMKPQDLWFLLSRFGYFAHVSRGINPADPFHRHIEQLQLDGPKDLQQRTDISELQFSLFLTAGLRILSDDPEIFEAGVTHALANRETKAVYFIDRIRPAFTHWTPRSLIADCIERAYEERPPKHARLA